MFELLIIEVDSLVIFLLVRETIWRKYSIVEASIVLKSLVICNRSSFLNWISLRKLSIFCEIKLIVDFAESELSK